MSLQNNHRIVRNTAFLYFRMLVTMGVTLFTARIVINALGITDYGIYQIIGGTVALSAMFAYALSSATQRFLSIEIGRNDPVQLARTFGASVTCHFGLAILLLCLLESVGLWLTNSVLNIPQDRMAAANWIYQFSAIAILVNVIKIPYNASIVAHEEMSFFAASCIAEAALKLTIALLIVHATVDRLVLYVGLMLFEEFILLTVYVCYCRYKFIACRQSFLWDKATGKAMISFAGWTTLGSAAIFGTRQGSNILLNIFGGVAANAAMGVAQPVSQAIFGLVSNFQLAFNPQIVKLYASKETEQLHALMLRTALLSYYLMLILAVPFLIDTEVILATWLHTVPKYSAVFCRLTMVYFLIDSIQAPLWMLIQASGMVRNYQLWLSTMIAANIPISLCLLKAGYPIYVVLVVWVFVNALTAIIRTGHVWHFMAFPAREYVTKVILRGASVTCLSIGFAFGLKVVFAISSTHYDILSPFMSLGVTGIVILLVGLSVHERKLLWETLECNFRRWMA